MRSPSWAAIRRDSWGILLAAWLVLSLLVVGLLLFVLARGPAVSVSVEGTSEVVELETVAREQHWTLDQFALKTCDQDPASAAPAKSVDLTIERNARIRIEKLEDGDRVTIDITRSTPPDGAVDCQTPLPVQIVRDDGTVVRLKGRRATFTRTYPSGSDQPTPPAIVLPVSGRVTLGEELGDGVQTMLIGGTATMHADHSQTPLRWLPYKLNYAGEPIPLLRGDRVLPTIEDAAPTNTSQDRSARGYFRLVAKGPIQFAILQPTDAMIIQRAGNAIVRVDLSIWQRLKNEPIITGLGALLVALVGVIEFFKLYAELLDKHRAKRASIHE